MLYPHLNPPRQVINYSEIGLKSWLASGAPLLSKNAGSKEAGGSSSSTKWVGSLPEGNLCPPVFSISVASLAPWTVSCDLPLTAPLESD